MNSSSLPFRHGFLHFRAVFIVFIFVIAVIENRTIPVKPYDMDGLMVVIINTAEVCPASLFVIGGNGTGHDAVQVLQFMAELFLHALVVKNGGQDKGGNHGHNAHKKKTSINPNFHIYKRSCL